MGGERRVSALEMRVSIMLGRDDSSKYERDRLSRDITYGGWVLIGRAGFYSVFSKWARKRM